MCDVGYLMPILDFLGLSVLDLGPMYVTDRQTSSSDTHHRLMPPPYAGGGIIIILPGTREQLDPWANSAFHPSGVGK